MGAREGEREKLSRYPTRHGLSCTPAVCETYGGLGGAFTSLLSEISRAAGDELVSKGMPRRSLRGRWEADLSVALALHAAEAILAASRSAAAEPPDDGDSSRQQCGGGGSRAADR